MDQQQQLPQQQQSQQQQSQQQLSQQQLSQQQLSQQQLSQLSQQQLPQQQLPQQQQSQQQLPQLLQLLQQQQEKGEIGLKKSFVCSLLGFIRFGIIFFHLAGCITSLFVSQQFGLGILIYTFERVRSIYFYVTLSGFCASIPIYLFFLLSLDTVQPFKRLDKLVQFNVILLDLLFACSTCAISVFCVLKEIEYQRNKSNTYFVSWYYITNYDLWKMNGWVFITVGALGFITVFLYALDVLVRLKRTLKNKNNK